jgi:hypothetical protein
MQMHAHALAPGHHRCVRCASNAHTHKHTHRPAHDTYCSSTAIVVTQMQLSVMLYIAYLVVIQYSV